MKNKKGFTLAELLGVIVILVLLFLLVTPIFVNYIKGAKKTAYQKQVDTIELSAKRWAEDKGNIKLLPSHNGECVEVTIEKLKDSGLLDYNIKNPETGAKFADTATVIIKRENNSYTYSFNEDGTTTCSTLIESVYPKWVFVESTPSKANKVTPINVKIKSDKKIYENNLTVDDIMVRAGATIVDDANINLNCVNDEYLECDLVITNLKGNGKLNLVIAAGTMTDTELNKSRKTVIETDTKVDTDGPKITFLARETSTGSNYINKDDYVIVRFKAEDSVITENNLTKDDILVYIDGVEVTGTKELTEVTKTGKIEYELKISDIEESGTLSIKIPEGKIIDNVGNTNKEKSMVLGIKLDNNKPVVTLSPNERLTYNKNLSVSILVEDLETGVDEDSLKYIFTLDPTAEPTESFINGEVVNLENVEGEYYLVVKACDFVNNCEVYTSGKYLVTDKGPDIEITPAISTGYEKDLDITIKVTSAGITLDESTFLYTVAETVGEEPSQAFSNNEAINISGLTGEYYLIAKACDEDGNCTTKVGGKYFLDSEAPEIKYEPDGSAGVYYKDLPTVIKVTDNVELDYAKYAVTTDKIVEPNTTLTSPQEVSFAGLTGTYYLVTKACDKVGNCKLYMSTGYLIDNQKPGIGNISVTPNASTKKITSTVTVTDNVSLKKYEIYNPSGTKVVEQNISGTSYNVSYTQNARGTYKLRIYDHLDNYEEKTFTIPGYTVTFNVNNTSMGTVASGSVTVNYGDTASTTFSPKSGYKYKSVSSGCTVSNTTVSAASVTAAKTCTVTFEAACSFTSQEFTYTGAMQSWTVPCAGRYKLEVWGGQGGAASCWADIVPGAGGKGGYATGTKTLAKDAVIYIGVGGGGGNLFNGAGQGDSRYGGHGGHGGGGTHIGTQNAQISGTTASNLIIVAGGGGGGVCYNHAGGAGGGTTGGNGSGGSYADNNGRGGYGGTQTAGGARFSTTSNSEGWIYSDPGSYGQGGLGVGSGNTFGGAGGGGGYYGGGGGVGNGFQSAGAGGGGSGYIGGVTDGSMSNGQQAGNGKAKITYLGA